MTAAHRHAPIGAASELIWGMAVAMATRLPPAIYPGYIAFLIKKALVARTHDPEGVIASVGEMQTVGDCRYAIEATDFNGQRYKITIEVI